MFRIFFFFYLPENYSRRVCKSTNKIILALDTLELAELDHTDEVDPLDLVSGANTHNYSDTSFPYAFKIGAQFIISILLSLMRKYKQDIQMLKKENSLLKGQVVGLKNKQKR